MEQEFNISQQEFETIEHYLLGNMMEQELIDFENKLEKEQLLQKQVKALRLLINSVEKQSFLNKLDEFHSVINPQIKSKKNRKLNLYLKFAIAASIALLIGFSGYWFTNANQRLYAKYFKPDPGLPTVMSATANYDFYDAMVNYKRGDYKTAIKKWEKLVNQKPQNDTLNYFLGVAYLAEKNQDKAITYLHKVLNQNNTIFMEETYFFLGLAYLKNKDFEKSKQNFEKSNSQNSLEILSNLK